MDDIVAGYMTKVFRNFCSVNTLTELNALSRKGWEFVAVLPTAGDIAYSFLAARVCTEAEADADIKDLPEL